MNSTYQEPPHPQRAMAVAAHPDDLEFTAAGTLAKWARLGTKVAFVLATKGDAGSHEPGITREEVAAIRVPEQLAAAELLGVEDVTFLDHPDGEVVSSLELRRDIVREIRRFRPESVICFDPTRLFVSSEYINHPDHRAVAQAALDAIFPAASMPLVFEDLSQEGLEPHRVSEVLVLSGQQPNIWIDISETIDLKIEALRQHASQFGDGWDPGEMIREWARDGGGAVGFPYAETFMRIVLVRDSDV